MSIETQLREALASHAASIEPAEVHPYERVAGAVAKNRTRRRTVGAVAVAVVTTIAIGVPAVSSRLADGRTTPAGTSASLPPATDKAWNSIATWPTRGSLARDAALVDSIGEQFDGRAIFVEDVGATRVALVVSRADLVVGTGPRGASASDMTRSSSGSTTQVTNGVLGMSGGDELLIFTTPDRASVDVSQIPRIALDGTVSRTWKPLALTGGLGRTAWSELTRFRAGAGVETARIGFTDDEAPTDGIPCASGDCTREPGATQERDINDLVARMLDVDSRTVTTSTVFKGAVASDFSTPGLGNSADADPRELHVMLSRLSGGQILRTAILRDDTEFTSLELARPIDARKAASVPLISFGSGKSDASPTTVHVFVPSGSAVRAIGDASWPSSAIVPLTSQVASFEVPVSPSAFDENYRVEVLDGDRVTNEVRTTMRTTDVFDGTP